MRTRRCATIRNPAFSISALTAPVRLRAVASGLMMEKVRSTAIGSSFVDLESEGEPRRAYNGRPRGRQARACSPINGATIMRGAPALSKNWLSLYTEREKSRTRPEKSHGRKKRERGQVPVQPGAHKPRLVA